MTCTMPKANFIDHDPLLTRDYVLNCLDETFRGLTFCDIDKSQRDSLKREVAKLCKKVENVLL